MKYCAKCGKELVDEAVICTNCGCSTENNRINVGSQNDKSNVFAIAGFICSFFIPLLGLIFGCIGLSQANKLDGKGKSLSISAIIIATVSFLISIIIGSALSAMYIELLGEIL